jgi:hypothetical protein
MPPKTTEPASAPADSLPPLDDLEAELKLKHSRKGTGAACDAPGACHGQDSAAVAAAGAGTAADDMGASAVAQALAASGCLQFRVARDALLLGQYALLHLR